MDSIETLKVEASYAEPETVASSVLSGFLHLFSTLSDNSEWQPSLSIKSHKLWCQARALLLLIQLVGRM